MRAQTHRVLPGVHHQGPAPAPRLRGVVLDDQDIEATEAAARAADVLETLRALLDDRDREEA